MHVARGNLNGHNLFRLLIHAQVKFAQPALLISLMLLDLPLPSSVAPKTTGINDNVTGTAL